MHSLTSNPTTSLSCADHMCPRNLREGVYPVTAFQKPLLIAAACLIVLGGGLLFRFGTLSPCGMLTQELKAEFLQSMFAKNPTDPWEVAGVGLGAMLAGHMIDSFVSAVTPMQCTQALVRLKVEGKNIFADALASTAQSLPKDRFGYSTPPAPPASPSKSAKIEQDIASWNPISSITLKHGAPPVVSQRNLDSLKKWIDKYPITFDTSKDIPKKYLPPSKNFFEIPYIRQPLINLLDEEDFKRIAKDEWLINPIKLVTDHLVIDRCRPHACPVENAILSVNLYDGSIHVGFWNKDEQNSRKIRWFSTKGNYKDLPKEIFTTGQFF
jgi:hypothetical protein